MPIRLVDKNRDYKRYRHTTKEKIQLARKGFQHVLSSNVSAIAQQGKNLIVRFHGGATYAYMGKADLFDKMLQSNSKGKFVWAKLIRPRVPYRKVSSVPLESDEQFTDRDIQAASRELVTMKGFAAEIVTMTQLANLGIIATDNVVSNILVTNAI